eukprot:8006734-Heterocapsa_arctica.AAC.1
MGHQANRSGLVSFWLKACTNLDSLPTSFLVAVPIASGWWGAGVYDPGRHPLCHNSKLFERQAPERNDPGQSYPFRGG